MAKPSTTSAAEQYTDELREHVPGLAVSAIPRVFIVPCKPKGTQVVDLGRMWCEPERWPEARTKLVDPFHYGPGLVPSVPKAWSFADVAGEMRPERFDLPNPRWHTLTGEHVPWKERPGAAGQGLAAAFESMLAEVYRSGSTNTKRAEVVACLEHHRTKGGNAEALTSYVERMLGRWKEAPPTRMNRYTLQRVKVEDAGHLIKCVEAWLTEARKMPATPAKPVAKGTQRPELRLLALVHALRWLTGDKAADITAANADALAKDAGSMAKSAGKDLRKAYNLYTLKANSKAERLQDGEAYTVKARYLKAIPMLEQYPEAKALAEQELEEIRERE